MFLKNKLIKIAFLLFIIPNFVYSQFQIGGAVGYGGVYWDKIPKKNRLDLLYDIYLKWETDKSFSPKFSLFYTSIPSNQSYLLSFFPGHLNMKNNAITTTISMNYILKKNKSYSVNSDLGIGISHIKTFPYLNNNFESDFWEIDVTHGHQAQILPLIFLAINYEKMIYKNVSFSFSIMTNYYPLNRTYSGILYAIRIGSKDIAFESSFSQIRPYIKSGIKIDLL